MNKLKTDIDGKMPITLDDHRWFDAAYREAFYGIASAFGITAADSFKLSGCVVTKVGNTYTTTAGYIWLAGEIYKVEAQSITVAALHTCEFKLDIAYDPDGMKIFQNDVGFGFTHDTYEIRKAVLGDKTSVIPRDWMNYDAPTIHQVIATKLIALEGSFIAPTFAAGWSNLGSPNELCGYKKDALGTVYIKGVATSATPVGAIFTLPLGYRPAYIIYFPCYNGTVLVNMRVDTNGEVSPVGLNTEQEINISSITFKT